MSSFATHPHSSAGPGYRAGPGGQSVLGMLRTAHRELVELAGAVVSHADPRARRAREDFEDFSRRLRATMKAEEQFVYSALQDRALESQDLDEIVWELFEDHRVLRLLLQELAIVDPESEHWPSKFALLRNEMQRHFNSEESRALVRAEQYVSPREAELLELALR